MLAYAGFGPTYKRYGPDPTGRIPAETPEGFISESRAILDYIERANPQSPLLPDSAFGAAKVQELSQFIELYFELVARRLIPNLLMGTPPDPTALEEFNTKITKATGALAKLSSFDVFAYGDAFTLADIAAILNHPVVQRWHEISRSGSLSGCPDWTTTASAWKNRPTCKRSGRMLRRSASVHGTLKASAS